MEPAYREKRQWFTLTGNNFPVMSASLPATINGNLALQVLRTPCDMPPVKGPVICLLIGNNRIDRFASDYVHRQEAMSLMGKVTVVDSHPSFYLSSGLIRCEKLLSGRQ